MSTKNKSIDKSHLLKLGLKAPLLDKLDTSQITNLLEFSMENSKEADLQRQLLQLASMETSNKKGATYLAIHEIATIQQLKNLTADQIETVIADLNFSQDSKLAVKAVKKYIVLNQQEKMYFESGGVKGEYYVDPHSLIEEEEEIA